MNLNESFLQKKPKNILIIEKEVKALQTLLQKDENYVDETFSTPAPLKKKILSHIITMGKALRKEFNLDEDSGFTIVVKNKFVCEVMCLLSDKANRICIGGDIRDVVNISNGKVSFKSKDMCWAEIKLSTALFMDKRLTTEMLMGGILHEIGHCFEDPIRSLTSRLWFMNNIMTNTIYNIKNDEEFNKELNSFYVINMGNFYRTSDFLGNERFADEFAASYGYSEGIVGLLSSIEQKDLHDTNSKNLFEYMVSRIWHIIINTFFLLDPHPVYINRVSSIIHIMKKEAKNENIPIKYRKQLENQISRLEHNIDELYKIKEDDSLSLKLDKFVKKAGYNTLDSMYDWTVDKIKANGDWFAINQILGLNVNT